MYIFIYIYIYIQICIYISICTILEEIFWVSGTTLKRKRARRWSTKRRAARALLPSSSPRQVSRRTIFTLACWV